MGIRLINLESGEIKTVLREHEGQKLVSANSITFTDDPSIVYFTHSSIFSMKVYYQETLHKTGTGKIIQLNLKTGESKTVLSGLQFPNGIVYSHK